MQKSILYALCSIAVILIVGIILILMELKGIKKEIIEEHFGVTVISEQISMDNKEIINKLEDINFNIEYPTK